MRDPEENDRDFKFPPHDTAAERAVLASMMLSGDALVAAIESLQSEEFYADVHKTLFRCFKRLYAFGKPIEVVTIKDELEKNGNLDKIGGMNFLVELFNDVASGANIESYITIIKERCVRRRVLETAMATIRDVYNPVVPTNELLDRAGQAIFNISMDKNQRRDITIATAMKTIVETAVQRKETPSVFMGIGTGFTKLDSRVGGFRNGELIILAARPGNGKTTMALNIVKNACVGQAIPALMFSLEMTKEQLLWKLAGAIGHCDTVRAQTGWIGDVELDRFINVAAPKVYDAPFFVDDDPNLTIVDIQTRARAYIQKHNLKFIVVDYIQYVKTPNQSKRYIEVGEIGKGLKSLAKLFDMPIIALSQIRRPEGTKTISEPMLSDLRESGDLEQDADVVIFLHPEQQQQEGGNSSRGEELNAIIAKNRNGATGRCKLTFFKSESRIENSYTG